MNRNALINQIQKKKSYLCVGLDTDIDKIPSHLLSEKDPIYTFNRAIIDATADYCVAYKANIAFYEALGDRGWESLLKTVQYIGSDKFIIADGKRGDIGNTSEMYARAFFESMDFDAVTLSPYMGKNVAEPFLNYEGKWVIVLAITSNESSKDFQTLELLDNDLLYEKIISECKSWAGNDRLMYVVGATQTEQVKNARNLAPDYFFLVPGIGAQGGSLEEVSANGLTDDCGLLVNVSRNIIYASDGPDFTEKAAKKARELQHEMKKHLKTYTSVLEYGQ